MRVLFLEQSIKQSQHSDAKERAEHWNYHRLFIFTNHTSQTTGTHSLHHSRVPVSQIYISQNKNKKFSKACIFSHEFQENLKFKISMNPFKNAHSYTSNMLNQLRRNVPGQVPTAGRRLGPGWQRAGSADRGCSRGPRAEPGSAKPDPLEHSFSPFLHRGGSYHSLFSDTLSATAQAGREEMLQQSGSQLHPVQHKLWKPACIQNQ